MFLCKVPQKKKKKKGKNKKKGIHVEFTEIALPEAARKCFIAWRREKLLWLKLNWPNEDLKIKFIRLFFQLEIFSSLYASFDCRSSINSTIFYLYLCEKVL